MQHDPPLDGFDVSRLPARIVAKIAITDGCWQWTGARHPAGHGKAWFDGRYVYAHRLTFELLVGPISHGLILHHACHNPACVNPAHLIQMPPGAHRQEHDLNAFAAENAAKTTCSKGHIYDRVERSGARRCRQCQNARMRAWERSRR